MQNFLHVMRYINLYMFKTCCCLLYEYAENITDLLKKCPLQLYSKFFQFQSIPILIILSKCSKLYKLLISELCFIAVATYLFKNELVFLVELPGRHNVYGGQDSAANHSGSHSDRQQCVDYIDEKDCPPDTL